MPAPVPIQVRYGDGGLLAAAAAAVGQNLGLRDRVARDMGFLQSELDRRESARQANLRFDLESLKAAQGRQGASPTVAAGRRINPAMQRTLGMRAGIPDEQLRLIDQARTTGGEEAGYATFQNLMSQAQAGTMARDDEGQRTKQQYLRSVLEDSSLPAHEIAALETYTADPSVSMPQVRVAVESAMDRARQLSGKLTPTQATAYEVRGIDQQINELERQAGRLRSQIEDMGRSPTGPGSQFTQQPTAEVPQGAIRRFFYNINPIGSTEDVETRTDVEGLETFTQYHRLINEIEQLRSKRQQLIGGGGGPRPQATPQADPLGIL